jgi:hypothetical protein
MDGDVKVSGAYASLQSCTTGVLWSVDRGGVALRSGRLTTGSMGFNILKVSVNKGEVLYFTIGPDGDNSCDSIGLKLAIADAKKGRP